MLNRIKSSSETQGQIVGARETLNGRKKNEWKKSPRMGSNRTKLKICNRISSFLSRNALLRIYKQTVLPIFDYGGIVWGDCGKQNAQRLERLQNQAHAYLFSCSSQILYSGHAC